MNAPVLTRVPGIFSKLVDILAKQSEPIPATYLADRASESAKEVLESLSRLREVGLVSISQDHEGTTMVEIVRQIATAESG